MRSRAPQRTPRPEPAPAPEALRERAPLPEVQPEPAPAPRAAPAPAPAAAPTPAPAPAPARAPAPGPPAPPVLGPRVGSRPLSRSNYSTRRRRLVSRLLPALAVPVLAIFVVGWVHGPEELTPTEVGASIHDRVQREVIERTDDFSSVVGPLDCVELAPNKGNCLADVRSTEHQADHVMIAVAYRPDPDGGFDLSVKLP